MKIVIVAMTILLSCFSTAVMAYISMATPIGPWIAPTIVLLSLLILTIIRQQSSTAIALITIGSSIGGIVATASAFSFPTLYFLDADLFESWLKDPSYFCMVLAGLSFSAGLFGFAVAWILEQQFIVEEQLPFPIGQLIFKMISVGNQITKAIELMIGFVATSLFCILQDGLYGSRGLIPKAITLIPRFNVGIIAVPSIVFDMWPILWAIGFVTGHVIALPLSVGALSKIMIIDTLHASFFSYLSIVEFVLAFCSGMVVSSAFSSFVALPQMIIHGMRWLKHCGKQFSKDRIVPANRSMLFVGAVALVCSMLFLLVFRFSFFAIVFLLIGAFACVYQVAYISGKIGLAPLGRFATFVMLPAMLIFGLDSVQIVLVATFVEISCGIAADILFSRKMAYLMDLDRKEVGLMQLLGLIVCSLSLGIIFWFLISHFQLGSPELFAYKAQSRALLIDVKQFDYIALILGALFSYGLSYMRVNSMLVLGGLLMPINISLGLIFGGFLTVFVKNREEWEPFWSGIFAANSLWMLLKAVIG